MFILLHFVTSLIFFNFCLNKGFFFFLKNIFRDLQNNYFMTLKYCFSFLLATITKYHRTWWLKTIQILFSYNPGGRWTKLVSLGCRQGAGRPCSLRRVWGEPFPWPCLASPELHSGPSLAPGPFPPPQSQQGGASLILPCLMAFSPPVPTSSPCLPFRTLVTAFRAHPGI